MKELAGRIAVVTGGGSGMGRELVRLLVAEACNVAMCDVSASGMAETQRLCEAAGVPQGLRITAHRADVSDEAQVNRFRDEVARQHDTDKVHLLFNNAGIGGGGSMVAHSREEWERTFNICWGGVYHCTRAFLPMLLKAEEGHIVNTSSVNGFWASLGAGVPHTAYSTAKFAVKGFSEALIEDLRISAPNVRVALVMPGHIATNIVGNSMLALGMPEADAKAANQGFFDSAPLSAAGAATIILDGVRSGAWRILVGDDAHLLDQYVRACPEDAYDYEKLAAAQTGGGEDMSRAAAEWFADVDLPRGPGAPPA
jgi:NAD(P)-dependent dehydrogenase (short-subunit alcohol dehydrogenase family)